MKAAVTTLVFCVAALLALGMVMLYSASMAQVGARYLAMQLVWCAAGLVACVVAAVADYRWLKKLWWLLFAAAVLLLVLVLSHHFGSVRGGARRWFSFGRVNFQPSEFGKLALLIALAWYGERFQRQMPQWRRGMLIPGLGIAVIAGLIFKEPDVGNALVLGLVGSIVLLVAGMRLRYFLPPALIVLLAVSAFIYHNPMRSERIYSWLHLEETRRAKGLQAYEAMVALGSGGIWGKGLGDGRQKLGFVPEDHTDFIFSIVGEELGLVATLLVVAAFVALVVCGLCIAVNACDAFGMLLASGITFLIGVQAFVNIGVVTGALPNKGLPLPFISYGGSNLLMMLSCVGLLLSVARLGRPSEALKRNPDEAELRDSNPFRARKATAEPAARMAVRSASLAR